MKHITKADVCDLADALGVDYTVADGTRRIMERCREHARAQRLELATLRQARVAPRLVAGKPEAGDTCRVCGCTDDDCRQCIEKTGQPCRWVEPNLCSACVEGERYPGMLGPEDMTPAPAASEGVHLKVASLEVEIEFEGGQSSRGLGVVREAFGRVFGG